VAVTPFRALLSAHGQATWNQSVRELGRRGQWVVLLALGLAALLFGGMLLAGSGALGWLLGSKLDQAHTLLILGGLLTLIGFGGGLLGGILGGARQLAWESYRSFPLRLSTLFSAELLAGTGDLIPLALGSVAAGLLLGVGFAAPSTLPLLPLIWLETLLTLLTVQLLVEGLATLLVKRLRVALLALGILAWLGTTLLGGPVHGVSESASLGALSEAQMAKVQAVGQNLGSVVKLLPGTASARSLALATQGRWDTALGQHGYPLALLALLMVGGARLMRRETEAERRVAKDRKADRLWSFGQPAEGIARLHFKVLMGSHLGKFAFLMPLMTLVLLKGPFAHAKAQTLWSVPAAFAYLSLAGNNFVFNQFGFDRHGVKALLLLPITAQDLLKGKLLGMAAHQGLQALFLAGLLGLLEQAGSASLLSGILLMGCIFLAQASVGQWTSAWAPRPIAMDSLKKSNMPFTLVLLAIATSLFWSALFGGTFALTAWLAPLWVLPIMALLFALTLTTHLTLLPAAAAYLDQRREVLVERLG